MFRLTFPTAKPWLFGAALVLAALIAYLPAIKAGFIWDDDLLLTANPQIQSSHGFADIWLGRNSCEYTPLTQTMFWAEHYLWQNTAVGYHIVNVLLHAIAAVLLWRALLGLRIPGAWLAALLFTVHPVNVASVAWIAEGKNTLSAALFFAVLLLFINSHKRLPVALGAEQSERDSRAGHALLVAAAVLFLLAGLSKGAVVGMPLVLAGCILWMNGKVTRRDLVCLIPFGLIGLGIAVVTVHFQAAATDYRLETSRFAFRLARAGSLPWLYLREIFLPVGLSPLSQQWRPDLHSPITYLPLLLLLSLLLVFVWKRHTWGKALLLASLYYLWMLLPVLGLIWMTFQQQAAWADWWQYLAVPAIFAVIAAGFAMVVRSGHKSRTVCAYVSLGLAISLLLAQTWRRCAIYDSMESYCRAVISEQPHMWALQNNLGIILKERGEFAQAAACYRAALRDNPGYVQAHNNLANVLQAQGEWKQAEAEFWAALQLEPRNCEVLANLSQTFFVEGKMRAALVTNAKAIKADPINPEHYVQFGVKLLANNQFNKALVCFKNARVLSPPNSRFELELARSLIGTSPVMLARCELQLPTWSQPIDR